MDETPAYDLPSEEQQQVWKEAENKFWIDFNRKDQAQHVKAEIEYQEALTVMKTKLKTLEGTRDELQESRERLAKELRSVEEALAHTVTQVDENASSMNTLEQDFRQDEQDRMEQRDKVTRTMVRWFRIKRGEQVPAPSASEDEGEETEEGEEEASEAVKEARSTAREPPAKRFAPKSISLAPAATDQALTDIVDAEGRVIGPIMGMEPWNQYVKMIQEHPIKRPVMIRRRRKFTEQHLAGIYERVESKGVKWLSCMIQATGEIQGTRCHSCQKDQGAFEDCIIVGGPFFPKCGNCEWNRQGCHGAAPGKDQSEDQQSEGRTPTRHRIGRSEGSRGLERRAATQEDARGKHRQWESEDPDAAQEHDAQAYYDSVEMDDAREEANEPGSSKGRSMTFREPRMSSRPTSRDRVTPTAQSGGPSPLGSTGGRQGDREEVDLTPITRDNLVLRHDGTVYTHPEIMEGVPVEKIDRNHPYWDPRWLDIRSLVEPSLAQWQEKKQAAMRARDKGDPSVNAASLHQIGRQVNRGLRILEFLEHGEISPYQLLGKRFMNSGKGSITTYDTLFRMCETLGELAKFGPDVEPLEWMRHRLHELWLEQGASFNLSRTMHNFYNDAKLCVLRTNAGFKKIGRPSGYKMGSSSGMPSLAEPPLPLQLGKRKSSHLLDGSPIAEHHQDPAASLPQQQQQQHEQEQEQDHVVGYEERGFHPANLESPSIRRVRKQARHNAEQSDTDSWSGAPIGENDYRVYQVKSRLYTSSVQVTQYLHWVEEEQTFEHQVLKEDDPVSWGVLRQPMDFSVRIEDVREVMWSPESLFVHVVAREGRGEVSRKDGRPRGDVMVAFKRESTLRRFVEFCGQLKMKCVEEVKAVIDQRWAEMQSERLPDKDEEVSDELKG